jgi:hypothetical protein
MGAIMVGRYCSILGRSLAILVIAVSCSDSTGPTGPINLSAITGGDDHNCLILKTGLAQCWGWGGFGQ